MWKKREPTRQMLLVKKKTVLVFETWIPLYNQREGRLQEQNTCITCAARRSAKA